uniref:Uncharacterized protein n=1 Tax=Brassica campestris TaxID=3711 RepID=M4F9A5_BRACM
MNYDPYSTQTSNFVDLLNSQQDVEFGLGEDSVPASSSQVPHFGEIPVERKERKTWTPIDDQVPLSREVKEWSHGSEGVESRE